MKFVARGQVCFNSICFVFFVSRLGLVWGRIGSCLWGRVAGIGGRWSGFYAYKFLHWIGPGLFPCGCGWGGVWGCGGGPVRCPKSRAGRGVRASLTEVYPAGKLQ